MYRLARRIPLSPSCNSRIARVALLTASASALSGCAALVTAFKNDPLQHYDAKIPAVYAMTGDRRTAVLMEENPRLHFCAESLPDAVAAYSAASKANANIAERGSGGFEDATYAGLLQTFQRTEIAEVYRQMGWNLCLAWAQKAITSGQYHALLEKYVNGGLDAISKRASQEQKWPTIAPGSLFIGPGAASAAQPEPGNKPGQTAPTAQPNPAPPPAPNPATPPAQPPQPQPAQSADPPGTLVLGDGVKLQRANSLSGYCIKAPAGYVGGGSPTKPPVSRALPLCS